MKGCFLLKGFQDIGVKMETSKKILVGVLVTILVVTSAITIIYKDKIFLHKMTVRYPDGCEEKFENGNLVTPECIEGRLLKQQQESNNMLVGDIKTKDDLQSGVGILNNDE